MSVLPGLLQPDPLPNVTTTRTDTPNVPEYYNNYLNSLAQAGQTAIGADPNSLVAGFTNLQNQGFANVGQAANAYQPGLNQATAGVNQAVQAGQAGLGQAQGALGQVVGSYLPGTNQAINTANQAIQTGQAGGQSAQSLFDLVQGSYAPGLQQGTNTINQAVGSYIPGLDQAQAVATRFDSGITEADINQFMNPYATNVVDEMARLNQQNVQRGLLPSLKGAFVGSGSLGSQRYANATGQALSDNSLGLLGQQAGALSQGYQQSVANALDNARLGQSGATLLGNLAGQRQTLGIQGGQAQTQTAQLAQQLGLNDVQAQASLADLRQRMGLQGSEAQSNLAGQLQSRGLTDFNAQANFAKLLQDMGIQGADAQSTMAARAQQLGLTGAQAQLQAGALQQQLEQAKIEAPLTRAANAAQLLRGLNIPTGATSTVTGPGNQSQFGLSPLNQIGSLASLLGAIPSGNTTLGSQVGGFLGNIFSGLNNSNLTFPSGTPVLDQGFDPDQPF